MVCSRGEGWDGMEWDGMGWAGQVEAKILHLPEFDLLWNLCQHLKYQEATVLASLAQNPR